MTNKKQLEDCHTKFLDICFGSFPMERVHEVVRKDVTGYGTNINEKIQSFQSFLDLLHLQREESGDIQMQVSYAPVSSQLGKDGNFAIYVDEVTLHIHMKEGKIQLNVRISSVLEYAEDKWKVVHFHGSFAQGMVGDRDTWSVNEWRKKNEELEQLIKQRTEELHTSIRNLKSTQAQLIQSEKMASLGELTAGIAHEIQNPLNFVNNFSEINDELISELVNELNNGNAEEAKAIAADIKNNAQKINEHGRRAGAIVKGMLEHSRKSDGHKEPTDINQLADECLRLAYHGMRAKDKDFNSAYKTAFDESLPAVNLVSQDMSRVLLNLINNAFYAVHERAKAGEGDCQPQVTVSTALQNDKLIIAVKDNGNGIPDAIRNKIFQPFFTTKPAGSGTGLGLSLSYDIIKAHGGDLTVRSSSQAGTIFEIEIPAHV